MKKKQKFVRLGYWEYSKLGLRRKKKLKYRRAKGRDNKVRLKMKGHLRNVSIGYRNEKAKRGLFSGKKQVIINNLDDLKKLQKNEVAIVAKIGKLKKIEIAKYSIKNNIRLSNLNSKKYLEKIEQEENMKKEEKEKKQKRRVERDKKLKEAEKKEAEKKEQENKKEEKGIEEKIEEDKNSGENKK
ncbi:MAG: eL32 family ribosomal protein [Nanoarchaeota archaeon]|nr:eL32 family ribosomal protein [Nanoarchaeota archaeon]